MYTVTLLTATNWYILCVLLRMFVKSKQHSTEKGCGNPSMVTMLRVRYVGLERHSYSVFPAIMTIHWSDLH